jgi:hypothetical protein
VRRAAIALASLVFTILVIFPLGYAYVGTPAGG